MDKRKLLSSILIRPSLVLQPASRTGTFKKNITIPSSAQPGNHTVKAVGQKSRRSAQAQFLVQSNIQADWPQFGFAPEGGRYNNNENTINVSNVSGLVQDWAASTGGGFSSSVAGSPAVVNGMVYVGSDKLYAFNASSGTQMWTASTAAGISGSPAVANGIVYVGSDQLYAFNASSGTQMWTALLVGSNNGSPFSPTVANGVVLYHHHYPQCIVRFQCSDRGTALVSIPRKQYCE